MMDARHNRGRRAWERLVACVALTLAAATTHAGSVQAVLGASHDVDVLRLGWRSDAWRTWTKPGGTRLELRTQADLSYWHARGPDMAQREATDLGITPILHTVWPGGQTWAPYLDVGAGLHLVSHTRIGRRDLSTAVQFGELIGAGLMLDPQRRLGIGVLVQHESNGGIKKPNGGFTYVALTLSYRY